MKQLLLCALFFWSAATWSMEEREGAARPLLSHHPETEPGSPPPPYASFQRYCPGSREVVFGGAVGTILLAGAGTLYSLIHTSTASSPEEAHNLNVLGAITGGTFVLALATTIVHYCR